MVLFVMKSELQAYAWKLAPMLLCQVIEQKLFSYFYQRWPLPNLFQIKLQTLFAHKPPATKISVNTLIFTQAIKQKLYF